jgi:three-Cys-motif partner protein
MKEKAKKFGGSWTEDKLDRIRKYMAAYTRIMNKRPYHFIYVDAFAGSGYIKKKDDDNGTMSLYPEMAEEDSRKIIDGSAKIALQVEPRFKEYIFIEKAKGGCVGLEALREEFPDKASDIGIIHDDANSYLKKLCHERDWKKERILVFIDPYGMSVEWETIADLAGTKAADVWVLFPLGIAVNRMLKKDGDIPTRWVACLDRFFGNHDWFDTFYHTEVVNNMFGPVEITWKETDFDAIGKYFVKRLETVFEGVAQNPLALINSRGVPLFLLCFATANPYAVDVAIRIAQDILKRKSNG